MGAGIKKKCDPRITTVLAVTPPSEAKTYKNLQTHTANITNNSKIGLVRQKNTREIETFDSDLLIFIN